MTLTMQTVRALVNTCPFPAITRVIWPCGGVGERLWTWPTPQSQTVRARVKVWLFHVTAPAPWGTQCAMTLVIWTPGTCGHATPRVSQQVTRVRADAIQDGWCQRLEGVRNGVVPNYHSKYHFFKNWIYLVFSIWHQFLKTKYIKLMFGLIL